MSHYTPDSWVVLEFTTPHETIRKVFAGWYGGFTQGDSWKLNSGIVESRQVDNYMEFDGYSGSTYRGYKNSYGMSGYMQDIFAQWQAQAKATDGAKQIRLLDLAEVVVF